MKKLILIIAASALIVGFIPACGKKDFVAEINALEQKIPDTNFEWKSRCQELSRMIKAYQNGQAIDKNRALGFAAAFGLPSLVEDLVENGADVNARFSRVSETETEILMEREIRSALKRRGETRSEAELRKQYREQARKRAEENARPILSGAIGTLSVECTEILLKHGANLREVDSESGVLAGVIYSLPPAEFFKRINEDPTGRQNPKNIVKMVELLLRYGADANKRGGGYDLSALQQVVVGHGEENLPAELVEAHKEILHLLIKNGALVDLPCYETDSYGRPIEITPLVLAASKKWSRELIKPLLDGGADAKSAIEYLMREGNTEAAEAIKSRTTK